MIGSKMNIAKMKVTNILSIVGKGNGSNQVLTKCSMNGCW